MILIFVTAASASYLLTRAVCLKSSPEGKSQVSYWTCFWTSLAFVILLLITVGIVAWIWWDKIAVYGWLDPGLILASPELSILVLGVLTGALFAYWHTKVLAKYPFHINTKLHMIWFWIIGSLVALGIALPLLSLISRDLDLHSLQTPAFSVEFSQSIGVAPLQFEIEYKKLRRAKLKNLSSTSDTLKKDIIYLEKKKTNEAIRLFSNARQLSDNYLQPIAKCAQFAFRERQLDRAQILPHIRPVAHALRRLLIKDSAFEHPLSAETEKDANNALQEAVELLKKRSSSGRKRLLELVGPVLDKNKCPEVNLNNQPIDAVGLSQVPHLYLFIARIYLIGDDPEAALAVIEEGDSESNLFRNDMNYNRIRGWILYVLQRPLSESIKFHERAFDFADRVIETEEDRNFVKRYAKAHRYLRQELAFLLAQAGLRKDEALAYARTYFEEANGRRNSLPRSESSIAIGRIQNWQKSDIYDLTDEIYSYTVYGYVVMAFGSREVEPNIKALRTARQLFRDGLDVYKAKKEDLDTMIGKNDTDWIRAQLKDYLKQTEFLIKQATSAS